MASTKLGPTKGQIGASDASDSYDRIRNVSFLCEAVQYPNINLKPNGKTNDLRSGGVTSPGENLIGGPLGRHSF